MGVAAEDVRGSGIQVIARAAEMLRLLQAHPGGLSQAEIGDRLGMARSTVSRILNALDDEGLVASRGAAAGTGWAPRSRGWPVPCASASSWTCTRSWRNCRGSWGDGRPVDPGRGPRDVRRPGGLAAPAAGDQRGGRVVPLHCCANGKALLAGLPPERLPTRLARLTANTITSPAALRKELDRVRTEGVAYDREEQTEGICAVGAVLKGVTGQEAAVSVPVPAQRFYGRESELAAALLDWVDRVAAALGKVD